MKTQNPFDRFKKRNYIPRSAFPARKMTRTSLPLGRAVPLYECIMSPGDHIKVPVAQLSRFMEMSRPVMQNFKVTFAAFYVPYVSFDRFFHFHKELNPQLAISNDAAVRESKLKQITLNARDYFNAATPDSMRNHPIMADAGDMLYLNNLEGSLIDHLGYRIFNEKEQTFRSVSNGLVGQKDNVTPTQLIQDYEFSGVDDFVLGSSPLFDRNSSPVSIVRHAGGSAEKVNNPFFTAILMALHYRGMYGNEDINNGRFIELSSQTTYTTIANPTAGWFDVYASIAKLLYGKTFTYVGYVGGEETEIEYKPTLNSFDLWGMSLEKLIRRLANMYSTLNLNSFIGFEANTISYLAYMSIYSDWFLPETFVDCDDFRADVASAYMNYAANKANIRLKDAYHNSWTENDEVAGRNPYMDFYLPYLSNYECLPVLKSLDTITGARRNDYSELTPMADTIEENFAQRMLARFRDLVNRIGVDYRDNFQVVYGTRPDDASLLRTQVIGYRDFDVLVGDVQQTGATSESGNFGSFGGYAISRDKMKPFEWTAKEHGLVMVLAWVVPKMFAYGTTIDRNKLKSKYEDYLLPEFGGVGYQDIPFAQINGNGNAAHDNSVFGYQERYFEYMHMDNEVSGQMRTIYKDWHDDLLDLDIDQSLATKMDYLYWTPADNLNRIFVDTVNDPVIISAYFDGSVTRALPRNIRTDF